MRRVGPGFLMRPPARVGFSRISLVHLASSFGVDGQEKARYQTAQISCVLKDLIKREDLSVDASDDLPIRTNAIQAITVVRHAAICLIDTIYARPTLYRPLK